MSELNRYITDEAVQAASQEVWSGDPPWIDPRPILAAALPHIVPQIRADALREAADRFLAEQDRMKDQRVAPYLWANARCNQWADEAVAE